MSGQNANNTIRVKGVVKNKPFSILIDSGSTNNFLEPQAAKRLKLKLENTKPILVYVADGFKVESTQLCKQFKWSARGQKISNDMINLAFGKGGCCTRCAMFKNSRAIFDFYTL